MLQPRHYFLLKHTHMHEFVSLCVCACKMEKKKWLEGYFIKKCKRTSDLGGGGEIFLLCWTSSSFLTSPFLTWRFNPYVIVKYWSTDRIAKAVSHRTSNMIAWNSFQCTGPMCNNWQRVILYHVFLHSVTYRLSPLICKYKYVRYLPVPRLEKLAFRV